MAIPGAFLGLGCGLLARHRSIPRGVFCAVAALGLSLFTEWKFHHFLEDPSFTFMLRHVQDLSPVTLLMMGIATIVAFWVGQDAGFGVTPWSRASRKRKVKSRLRPLVF